MQLMTKKTRKKAIQGEKGIRERMSKNKEKRHSANDKYVRKEESRSDCERKG